MDWRLVAAIPPVLLWFALFVYLARVEAKLKKVEARLGDELKG